MEERGFLGQAKIVYGLVARGDGTRTFSYGPFHAG